MMTMVRSPTPRSIVGSCVGEAEAKHKVSATEEGEHADHTADYHAGDHGGDDHSGDDHGGDDHAGDHAGDDHFGCCCCCCCC